MNIKIFVHPDLNTIVDTNIMHYDHDLGLQTNWHYNNTLRSSEDAYYSSHNLGLVTSDVALYVLSNSVLLRQSAAPIAANQATAIMLGVNQPSQLRLRCKYCEINKSTPSRYTTPTPTASINIGGCAP